MNSISTNKTSNDAINIFLIGNNPIELSNIYEKLKEIKTKSYHAEIGFDLKTVYKKIMRFRPSCILIDDNLEEPYLKSLLGKLSSWSKTRDIPIAILKNSNYGESYLVGAQEFILKDGITSEALSRSILNSIRLRSMQKYLYTSYKKRQSQFLNFFSNN
ncbi:hypothetical protein JMN32_08205 [Fulvivirga sp. 29W222]|uniref:Response regulatory domain-containing protein n=1 Tax=Fulvivirga marina TaxID=2494733 RepID=A0A937FWI0_9BACT|nr:hypothetical protein [Fulvivirga marina]MBL6446287.1 hypothetical protein [Fulvivirga marina]